MHLYMLHSACVLCIDIMGMLPNLIESCFSKCTSSISSMDEGNDWKLEQCKSKSIMQIKHCREEVVRATLQKEQTFGKRNHKKIRFPIFALSRRSRHKNEIVATFMNFADLSR